MVRVSVVFSGGIDILRVSECHLLQYQFSEIATETTSSESVL